TDTHAIALVGLLPDTPYEVRSDPPTTPLTFTTETAPDGPYWPTVDVLVDDRSRAEPGWTLIPVGVQGMSAGVVVLLDPEGRPRWWFDDPSELTFDAVLDPVDGVWLRVGRGVRHLRWSGALVSWFEAEPEADQIPLEGGEIDHELLPDGAGGFWTFGHAPVAMEVPADYGSPELVAAVVDDPRWRHVRADGSLAVDTPIAALLDPSRSGYDALAPSQYEGLDFVHANAGIPLDDGGALISCRNQDAILRLDPRGELQWILGDPAGWSGDWAELLLQPEAPIVWPYHQHGIEWDGATSTLRVFDNHAAGAIPPAPRDPQPSRAVAYEIDEQARTLRERWTFDAPSTGPLASVVLGEVDELPITGNHLAVYGWIESEGPANGWGKRTARLVEFTADGEPVYELRLRAPLDTTPEGVWVYRAERGVDPAWVR
ncbi:MAG: aryl-sulfate sulfotransferase, partial [Myxococcota bacterium]